MLRFNMLYLTFKYAFSCISICFLLRLKEEEEEIMYGAPSRTSPERLQKHKDRLISLRVVQFLQ